MMRWIVGSSLRLRLLVVAAAVALPLLAFVQLRQAPVDVYPEFLPPSVQIQTEALGLSAAEVEQLITVPLEQDLLNGVPWLDQIRSQSRTGLSTIDLVFQQGTDVLKARQMVQERMSQAHALPAVGSAPIMVQTTAAEGRVMMVGLSSKTLSPIEMSVLARWKIKPRLMGIPGVANVAIWGQRDRQLQVQVDPAKLRQYGVTVDKVIDTTGNALWVSPLTFLEASTPGTGGFVDTANQRFAVQHVSPISTPDELAAVTFRNANGKTMRLGDVADVIEDHQPLIGDAMLEDGPALMLVVQKFPEANTREVTQEIDKAMAALAPGLTGITIDTHLFRPAGFISEALHNVGTAAVVALLLGLALLTLFLLSWRAAVVMLAATMLSLLTALCVLDLRGASFNVMVLAGLVVALAVVVDDAAVSVLAIRRRLHEHQSASERPAPGTVVEAALQDRGPLLYATLVLLVAVVPLLMLTGVAGSFSRPLVTSYALALLASLVVALVVTPALSLLLLTGARTGRTEPPAARRVEHVTGRVLTRFVSRPRAAYLVVGLLAVAALGVLPQLSHGSLIPPPQDRQLVVPFHAAPGSSIPRMDRIAARAIASLRSVPGVTDVGAHVGRAISGDQIVDTSSGELWVSIARSAPYQDTVDTVRQRLSNQSAFETDLLPYAQDQLRAATTGSAHPVVVRLYGADLGVLRAQARKVRAAVATVDGITRPRIQQLATEPTVQIEVDLAAARRYGLRPGDVRRETATLLSGLLVGNLYEEQKIFDVVVWGSPALRSSVEGVGDLLIDTPRQGQVRLRDVASVRLTPYPTVIRHDDVARSLDVTADVAGRNVGAVLGDVQRTVSTLSFPLEYHAEVLDQYDTQRSHDLLIAGVSVGALVAILLLLQAATGSWRFAALLLATLPLAAVGGALAAASAGGIRSVGALAGLLAVLGLATRHNVVLVRHLDSHTDGGRTATPETVLRAVRDRAVPVVLSVLTTGAAALPLVVLGGIAGQEIVHPLAVVLLGGLVTSTVLTLFVLPILYLRLAPAAVEPPPSPPVLIPESRISVDGHDRVASRVPAS